MVLQPLELRFLQSIRQIFRTKKKFPPKIAIALSGGVDSMCLTHLLHKVNQHDNLGIKIHTISMDHGLRRESGDEISFIGDQIKKLGLHESFHAETLDLSNLSSKDSFEEVARDERYNKLHEICERNGIENIMTGHHFDDNLETFVLRLLGNSGIMGLRGIKKKSVAPYLQPPYHSMHKVNLIRPLLDFTKDELYVYATENGIEWVEDHTNGLEITKRNTVRSYLRQNPKKKDELVVLHRKILDFTKSIENRVNSVYHQMNKDGKIKFSAKGLNIQFDKQTLEENSDLVIATLLFKLLYPYSPSPNYHYSFHKLLANISKIRDRETFTLLNLKWNFNVKNGEKITDIMIRRQNADKPSTVELIIPSRCDTGWFLFDNIYWFKFKNISRLEKHLVMKTLTMADKPARICISGQRLADYEGSPFVYNIKKRTDSFFPLIENRQNTPWKLKHNIYSFDSD